MNVDSLIPLVVNVLKSAPAILGWLVIARLAYDRVRVIGQPISPTDAAYTMVALAAFAYAVR